MALTDAVQTRAAKDPLDARVLLVGTPKSGKTTLLANWAPRSTLIIDTQHGTNFIDGEHHVRHIGDWSGFVAIVDDIAAGDREMAGGDVMRTVAIDVANDLWDFCDRAHAGRNGVLASATDDYQKSIRTAEGMWRHELGRLFDANVGVWIVTHAREKLSDGVSRYVSMLPERPGSYVHGMCDFILLAETLGPRRRLHTAPSARFEAGSRVPLPSPMELDARALYRAMVSGLNSTEVAA